MTETLQWLDPESLEFPPLDSALSDPNGLLAIGGDLTPERLIKAYSQGIFPWYNDDEPILWWSPSPRAIIPLNNFKINRSLRKLLNRKQFTVTVNQAFDQVIEHCAESPNRSDGTWIVEDMICAYSALHSLGIAHSIEVWRDNQLVGGLYGIAINGFFSGESMFYLEANASKVALVALTQLLAQQKITFIDCQINNPFLSSMGCIEVPRDTFIELKQTALKTKLNPSFWQPRTLL